MPLNSKQETTTMTKKLITGLAAALIALAAAQSPASAGFLGIGNKKDRPFNMKGGKAGNHNSGNSSGNGGSAGTVNHASKAGGATVNSTGGNAGNHNKGNHSGNGGSGGVVNF